MRPTAITRWFNEYLAYIPHLFTSSSLFYFSLSFSPFCSLYMVTTTSLWGNNKGDIYAQSVELWPQSKNLKLLHCIGIVRKEYWFMRPSADIATCTPWSVLLAAACAFMGTSSILLLWWAGGSPGSAKAALQCWTQVPPRKGQGGV